MLYNDNGFKKMDLIMTHCIYQVDFILLIEYF